MPRRHGLAEGAAVMRPESVQSLPNFAFEVQRVALWRRSKREASARQGLVEIPFLHISALERGNYL
jgi:hypothetical protein